MESKKDMMLWQQISLWFLPALDEPLYFPISLNFIDHIVPALPVF